MFLLFGFISGISVFSLGFQIQGKEISLSSKSVQLEDVNTSFSDKWIGNQAYAVNGEANGKQEKLILVPYADAGQTGGNIATWLTIKK